MTTYERALQIYQVLIGAARNRQILNYEIVGRLVGVPRHGLAQHLGHIMRYCDRHGFPPLTAIVVKQSSGKPGHGLITVRDLNKDIERVFRKHWYRLKPLTIQDFRDEL